MNEQDALAVWEVALAYAAEQRIMAARGREYGWAGSLDPMDVPTALWSWDWPDDEADGMPDWLVTMLREHEIERLAVRHAHRTLHHFESDDPARIAVCDCGALRNRPEALARCPVRAAIVAERRAWPRYLFGMGE